MRKRIISSLVGVFIMALALAASVAFAETGPQSPEGTQSVGEKAVKGLANVVFSPAEIVASPVKGVKDYGPFGFFVGLIEMPFKIAKRIGGGGTDFVLSCATKTSLVPDYPCDDIRGDED